MRAFVLSKARKKEIQRGIFAFRSTVECEPDEHKEMQWHSKETREEFLGPKNAKAFFGSCARNLKRDFFASKR